MVMGEEALLGILRLQVNKKLSFRYIKYEVSMRYPSSDVNRLLDL